jgi:type I restriction enzyme S subunit
MMGDWKETTIGEHIELATGNAFQSARFGLTPDSGTLLARGDNVKEGEFEWGEKARYWPTLTPDLERYLLLEGDVLLGMDGSKVGKNWVRVRNRDLPCLLVQRVARLRAKPTMDQGFLRYIIGNPQFRDYVARVRTGTSIPHISGGQIRSYEILLPPLAEQKAISAVLGALDDKIELNQRMNATLGAMARALFNSWFVDFEPVRAKLDGRKPKGLNVATAALFPDSFQDSVLGQIPKGWEISTLGSILDVLETGRRPKGGVSSYTSGIPSIGAESINGIGVFDYSKTKFIPPEFFEKTLSGRIAHFDVLLYKDGGKPGEFKPRVGMYGHEFPFKTFCINEHVFRMRSTRTGQSFLYFTVSDQRVLSDFANKGGKAAIPGINQPDVKSTPIVLPSKGITDAFNARADILCDQILSNAKQSRTLATLRDALLPKLLSGDLSVDKIKEGLVA